MIWYVSLWSATASSRKLKVMINHSKRVSVSKFKEKCRECKVGILFKMFFLINQFFSFLFFISIFFFIEFIYTRVFGMNKHFASSSVPDNHQSIIHATLRSNSWATQPDFSMYWKRRRLILFFFFFISLKIKNDSFILFKSTGHQPCFHGMALTGVAWANEELQHPRSDPSVGPSCSVLCRLNPAEPAGRPPPRCHASTTLTFHVSTNSN